MAPVLKYRSLDPSNENGPFCYQLIADQPTATTLPYGLTGLHIIHKTTHYPTYVFATFEQVDNLNRTLPHNDLFYFNRNAGIVNPDRQDVVARAHAISDQTETINTAVHSQLRQLLAGQNPADPSCRETDSPFLHYKLIGVQGEASNDQQNTDFFLSNLVTETNEALRSFSGTLNNDNGTINPMQINAYKGDTALITGGCKGCHGNAQVGQPPTGSNPGAYDFSFITQRAPFPAPDPVNQPQLKSQESDQPITNTQTAHRVH